MTEIDMMAGDESFTPAEEAYLSSRGENFEALAKEIDLARNVAQLGQQPDLFGQQPDLFGQQQVQGNPGPGTLSAQIDPTKAQQNQQPAQVAPKSVPSAAQVDEEVTNADGSRFVPVQAMHREREKRQALEAEISQFRERFARADERQKAINELLGLDPNTNQPAPKPKELIDPEKDIFGAFRQQQDVIRELQSQLQQTGKRFEAQTEEQQTLSAYTADARNFARATPDFVDAYNHLLNTRAQELEALGVSDQRQRAAMIAQEEKQIASSALKNGQSPSQVIYSLAKLRGFSPKPAQADPAPQAQQPASGQALVDEATRQLEAAKKGRDAFPSLTGTGGSGPTGLTVEALADMSEDEFERTYSKLSESDRRRLMGG